MPKIKGPKDGKVLTATFDGKSKQSFPNQKETNVLVLLSIVGNEYCHEKYLQAIIEHSVRSFKKSTFLIADEVYWHNIKEKPTSDKEEVENLKNKARKLGEEYLEKNIPFFLNSLVNIIPEFNLEEFKKDMENLDIVEKIWKINAVAKKYNLNFEIIRWNEWMEKLNHQYLENKTAINALYDSDKHLKDSIEDTAVSFSERRKGEDPELWKMRSRGYLLEESPGVMWIAAKLGYNFIAYPGEMIKAFTATKKFFIDNADENNHLTIRTDKPNYLVNWLEINFKRQHAPKSEQQEQNKEKNPVDVTSLSNPYTFFAEPAEPSRSPIREMFHGVTSAILSTAELSPSAKTDLLVSVLNKFIASQQPQTENSPTQGETPQSGSLAPK